MRRRLRASRDGHKVVDLTVSGASLLITRRDELAAILRRQALDRSIDVLRQRRTAAVKTGGRAAIAESGSQSNEL